jgi:hypothetical protein
VQRQCDIQTDCGDEPNCEIEHCDQCESGSTHRLADRNRYVELACGVMSHGKCRVTLHPADPSSRSARAARRPSFD